MRPRAVAPQRTATLIDKSLNSPGSGQTRETAANETYLSKVIAYIPIESVALYQAAFNQLGPGDPLFSPAATAILCATPLWQLWSTRKKNEPFAWDQAIVSLPAFIFWLIGLQSPLVKTFFGNHAIPWKEGYGTFFLIVGSLVLPALGAIVIAGEKLVRHILARRPVSALAATAVERPTEIQAPKRRPLFVVLMPWLALLLCLSFVIVCLILIRPIHSDASGFASAAVASDERGLRETFASRSAVLVYGIRPAGVHRKLFGPRRRAVRLRGRSKAGNWIARYRALLGGATLAFMAAVLPPSAIFS